MAFGVGDNYIRLPISGGKTLAMKYVAPAVGDDYVLLPTSDGGTIAHKYTAPGVGDNYVLLPTSGGRTLALSYEGVAGWAGLYFLADRDIIAKSANGTEFTTKWTDTVYGYFTCFTRWGDRVLASVAGDGYGGILLSIDKGESWDWVVEQTSGVYCNHNAILFLNETTVIATEASWNPSPPATGKILRSTDSGDNFSQVVDDMGQLLYCLCHIGDGVVLAGGYAGAPTYYGQVWKSDTYGASWSLAFEDSVGHVWDIVSRGGNSIAVSTSHMLLSTNGGGNWSETYDCSPVGNFIPTWGKLLLCDGDYVMCFHRFLDNNYFLVSDDNGETWTEGLGVPSYIGDAMLIGSTVVVGVADGKLYSTTDHGDTWTEVTDTEYEIMALYHG